MDGGRNLIADIHFITSLVTIASENNLVPDFSPNNILQQ